MKDFLTDMSFEDAKQILESSKDCDYMRSVYNVCPNYYGLIEYLLDMLENEQAVELGPIDTKNALRVNYYLPYALMENETTEFSLWGQAYVLLFINYFNLLNNDNQSELKHSIDIVKRLLLLGNCLSRLLCISNMYLEKHERINTLCPDSFKISKMYVDSLMNEKTCIDD